MRTERETEYLVLAKAAKRMRVSRALAFHWLEIGLLEGKKGRKSWQITKASVDRLAARVDALEKGYKAGELINKTEACRTLDRNWNTLEGIIESGELEIVGKWRNSPLLRRLDVERYKAQHPKGRCLWTLARPEGVVLCQRCGIVVQPGQDYCPDCERERAGGGFRWYEVEARPAASVGRIVYGG